MSRPTQAVRIRDLRHATESNGDGRVRTGVSRWEFDEQTPIEDRRKSPPAVNRWQPESRPDWRKAIDSGLLKAKRSGRALAFLVFAFALGFVAASGPDSTTASARLRERLYASNDALSARDGELELARIELSRLNNVIANSARYRIPADLSAKIYDIAVAEGIEPRIAYSLVRIESDFTNRAISSKGALGLTQLMPSTARFFEPKLQRADLFDPETNLRIGFRFLKELIAKYDGDVDLALHAYNRGPTVVDKVVRRGENPANGYAAAIMKGAQ